MRCRWGRGGKVGGGKKCGKIGGEESGEVNEGGSNWSMEEGRRREEHYEDGDRRGN